jgi:hypothetical protein
MYSTWNICEINITLCRVDQAKIIGQTSVGTHKPKVNTTTIKVNVMAVSCSRCSHSLSRASAAAHLLGLQEQILRGACMSVSFECCVLSGRGLRVRLFTHPEESHQVCVCVCVCVCRISSNPFYPTQLHLPNRVWINYTHAVNNINTPLLTNF